MADNIDIEELIQKLNGGLAAKEKARIVGAQQFAKRLAEFVEAESKGGLDMMQLMFGLTLFQVTTAYTDSLGNRGKARDRLGVLIDNLFDAIEGAAVDSGGAAILNKMDDARRRGDPAEMKRIMDEFLALQKAGLTAQ